jgi:uncharacterized protein (TIGR02147 family)
MDDYRAFLRQRLDANVSLRQLSAKIGASDAYVKHVLAGTRNLTPDKAVALAKALKLTPEETDELIALLLRDLAETREARGYFARRVTEKRQAALRYDATRRMPTVFSDALLWEIYTLTSVAGFKAEPAWIAARLTRATSERKVAQAVARLKELGADKGQNVVLKDTALVRAAYRAAARRALDHLEGPVAEEHFDSFCIVLSDGEFAAIRAILAEAKAKLVAAVQRSKDKESKDKTKIAFYNAQLFWASRDPVRGQITRER